MYKRQLHAGIDSIEHGIFLDDECIDWMVEHGTYLVPTLAAPRCILDAGVEKMCIRDSDRAVAKAREAQRQWAQLTYKKRSEVLFAMRQQLQAHEDELAQIITQENGKSLAESRAAVAKAIELCEFAVSIPALIAGKTEIVSTGIEVKEMTFPVGVLAVSYTHLDVYKRQADRRLTHIASATDTVRFHLNGYISYPKLPRL